MTLKEHIQKSMRMEDSVEILQIIGNDVADKTEEQTIEYLKTSRDEVAKLLRDILYDVETLREARAIITNQVLQIIDQTDVNILKRKVYGTKN